MLSEYRGKNINKNKARTRKIKNSQLDRRALRALKYFWEASTDIDVSILIERAAIQLDEGMWTLDITLFLNKLSQLFSPVLFLHWKKCKKNTYARHAD